VDAATIKRDAARAGFLAAEFERVARLTDVLGTLAAHPFLRPRLALKGGTALNIYHAQDVPRLSVDGDLNYIGQVDRDATEKEIPKLWESIESVAKERNYATSIDTKGARFRTYRLSYANVHGSKDSLKLDVNLTERVPVLLPLPALRPPAVFGNANPVTCLQLEEVAGMKVAAMILRGAARDHWDVASLPQRMDRARVRKIAMFYGLQYDASLKEWRQGLDALAAVTEKELADQVRPLLRDGAALRAHDLFEGARAWTSGLDRLSESEQEVVDALGRGQWTAASWFEGDWHNPTLDRHPGILAAIHKLTTGKGAAPETG
jgi:predicted nucleotidyltransferase component of viral defense system